MKIIALDSSTEACSVALLNDGELTSQHEVAPRKHAELLLPFIDGLLTESGLTISQIDAIAFGRGPGAFTGIRIATGVVQGVAYASDLPVIPVSTLATMAQGAWREQGETKVIAAIDARMNEVYWGAYELDGQQLMQQTVGECVVKPEASPEIEGHDWHGCGSGWETYQDTLSSRYHLQLKNIEGARLPNAIDVATLAVARFQAGDVVEAAHAMPVYLRDNVAEKKKR
ncbi:MAG: tRNA (adenosine(37)-N6)-threonylcarbamoyltransferase complex dimerization subunit type 1 TsaB [Gammaproteobacteria bacterium]|nr:tRNA (adenosine(37)-N6)-threonylcarbamoyltransferase complex dimerization subunit type 1 TsaB [Gammaproteobacteria bacterium]